MRTIGLIQILFLLLGDVSCIRRSHEDELRAELMRNYTKTALPSMPTTVILRFTVLHVDMNEKSQSLDIQLWASMEWHDHRLRWEEKKYPNIKKIAFPRDQLWHPDISLYNNAVTKDFNHFGDTMILVLRGGKVVWVPPASVKAMCVMDMTDWPHDIHNCSAKFGSWIYDGYMLDVTLKDEVVMFEDVTMGNNKNNLSLGEWRIIGSDVKRNEKFYDCCPEPYVSIVMTIVLERVAPAYAWLVQIPCAALSVLTLIVFLLPPSSGEKITLGGIGLILDFFFLMTVSQIIGHSPTHTPLLVKLISKQLLLTLTSVIVCAIVLRIVRDPHSGGLPRFIKGPLLSISGCFGLNGYRQLVSSVVAYTSRSMKGEDLELSEGSNGRGIFGPDNRSCGGSDADWLLLAAFIDRICLIIYIIIFLVNITCFSGVL